MNNLGGIEQCMRKKTKKIGYSLFLSGLLRELRGPRPREKDEALCEQD